MLKRSLVYTSVFIILFFMGAVNFAGPFKSNTQQQNQPPVVHIINPKTNSAFEWDAQVGYEITVEDKEDGNSKYDEINAKEVLLEVRHVKDRSKIAVLLKNAAQNDLPGLALIRTSNCFNCHDFNGKAIGPSFYEISKRYPATLRNIDSLAKHIREGSTGIWGKEKMPTHPELTSEETKNAVQWILKHAADADVSYYAGTTGSFRIKKPLNPKPGDSYMLTASYIDHGLKSAPLKRLKGQDVVVIYSK